MALIVLDAGALIAHFDLTDSLHTSAEAALKAYAADDLVLPESAYAETLVVPTRHGRLAAMRSHIQALAIKVEALGDDVAERAASIRARHRSLRPPDALVITTGDHLGADLVLTGDRRWQRVSKRVHVVESSRTK